MMAEAPQDHETAATSRELVRVGAQAPSPAPTPRPQAPFVAQLLACEESLQSYRRYRRAIPGAAAACYHLRETQANKRSHFERSL